MKIIMSIALSGSMMANKNCKPNINNWRCFASLYIAVGMWFYFHFGGKQLHFSIGFIWCFLLVFTSVIVCNEGFIRLLKRQSYEEYIKELLDNKLAINEQYKAIETITFEDLDTGCLCHLINVGKNENAVSLWSISV